MSAIFDGLWGNCDLGPRAEIFDKQFPVPVMRCSDTSVIFTGFVLSIKTAIAFGRLSKKTSYSFPDLQ